MIVDTTQTKIERQLTRPDLKNKTLYIQLLMQLHDKRAICTHTLIKEIAMITR